MMGNNVVYIMLFLLSTLISSFSQILLKKSAQKIYKNKIKEYINPLVIGAYILLFACTLLVVFAFKGISLSFGPIIEASAYVFIMILSALFLRETITLKKIIGNSLIIIGICIFSILG